MIMRPKSRTHRAELSAMILELQTNRGVLNELSKYYATFRFTGGNVSAERWGLAAINRYLNRPFAADRIVTAEAARYRELAEVILELGQSVARSGPKTLPCRFGIADTFGRLSVELRALGSRLESVMTKLLDELGPSPTRREKGFPIESVELEVAPMEEVGST